MNKTDTIVFMSAYETTKYSKSRQIFRKTSALSTLLDKHHLSYVLKDNKLISSKGALELCAEYDYIQQSTAFSFSTINEKSDIDNFEEISLIGAIGTLDTLECRLNIPFKYSFSAVILFFSVFGIIWGITEWRQNKRF